MELFEHWHSVGVGGVKPSASGVDTLKKVFLIYCYNCYLAEYVISVRLDAELMSGQITVMWPNTGYPYGRM